MSRPCGNPECSVSTHIGDCLSFGSGELDNYGFWEKPCRICAAIKEANDKLDGNTEYLPYWPEVKSKKELAIGDSVIASPVEDDLFSHAFLGTIINSREVRGLKLYSISDQEGNVYDTEANQLEVVK